MIGARGDANGNDRWYLPHHLDIGTGQSGLTWQVSAGRAYRFDWRDVSLAYRHMEWDFESSSRLDNVNLSGALMAAKLRF